MFANDRGMFYSLLTVKMMEMEKSGFLFYVTGSRFFGGVHKDSDYDFFVVDSPELRNWLYRQGFVKLSESDLDYADDPFFAQVFQWDAHGVIQVQCIREEVIEQKIQVQKLLAKLYQGKGLPGDKAFKRHLWKTANHVFDTMKRCLAG